ncbi:uncharacterized protein LOC126904473 isoform X2 [Daktulosphaira vitifoliae]|uniref:uncharacterized protein LOC126904473 isoform X2 n=1 Tax=Daktulosphaira vitifoliae TaxID=58002 RepID=UPI0021AA3A82|nr:uncharacterized protein LOC126904473 isoform X2 [Daktulosphaira vitifoliae]
MEISNLENYPVYILNVTPELSQDTNVESSMPMTTCETSSYNFYIPTVEQLHQRCNVINTSLNSVKQKNKRVGLLPQSKTIQKVLKNNFNQSLKTEEVISDKTIADLGVLLNDEDIVNKNKKVIKYDPKTNTNVIFNLVNPKLLTETVKINKIKRGRPRKEDKQILCNKPKSKDYSKNEKEIVECLLTTKFGRLSKPPEYLLNGKTLMEMPRKSQPIIDNSDIIGRKKVKYNVKSDFVCGVCHKTYLGHKRMKEHLEKFPSHITNSNDNQNFESELQDIFQEFNEPILNENDINNSLNGKKESHTQTEKLKNHKCGYLKYKKNLTGHLKQILKHLKKPSIIKSLNGIISPWDIMSSLLNTGNIKTFSEELNMFITKLRSLSEYLTLITDRELNSDEKNKMKVDETLQNLLNMPKGTYRMSSIPNEYDDITQNNDVWTIDSTKSKDSISPAHIHSSPIHLNLFDSQTSKVDFLLSSSIEESMLCDENRAALESVDGLVSERLRTMTDHLETNVPIIDFPSSTRTTVNVSQTDTFMSHGVYEVFTNDINLVPTSTEEFIKSLEQFEPLNDTENSLNTETRMLDFEDLHHTFNSTDDL